MGHGAPHGRPPDMEFRPNPELPQAAGRAATPPVAPRTVQRTGWSLPTVHTLLAIGPIGPSSAASV